MHDCTIRLLKINNLIKIYILTEKPCTVHDLACEALKTLKNNRARTVHLDRARTVHLYRNMEYNLLLRQFDQHCNMFISGLIHLEMFMEIELEYLKRLELFIINLN